MNLGVSHLISPVLHIDLDVFYKNWTKVKADIASRSVELDRLAGFSVNVNSNADMQALFFDKLHFRPERLGESKRPSFAAKVLKQYPCPEAKMVSELRSAFAVEKAFRSTAPCIDMSLSTITYRIQEESTTGRVYAGDPNVTGFPGALREAIVPEKGNIFIYGDFHAQELCVLAHICGEKQLLEDVAAGIDPFGKVLGELSSDQRADAKEATYAYMYGSKYEDIAYTQFRKREAIEEYFTALFTVYPRLADWLHVPNKVELDGFSTTLFGDKYTIDKSNPDTGKEIRRAVNFIIQGTAARILADAMKELKSRSPQSLIRVGIFDALLVEMAFDSVAIDPLTHPGVALLRECMEKQLEGKLRAKVTAGYNWRTVWE